MSDRQGLDFLKATINDSNSVFSELKTLQSLDIFTEGEISDIGDLMFDQRSIALTLSVIKRRLEERIGNV